MEISGDADPASVDPVRAVADLIAPLRSSWDTSPALVAVSWGPAHVLAYQNDASARLLGRRPVGVPLDEAFPELAPGGLAGLDRVLATGEPVVMARQSSKIPDVQGQPMVLQYVVTAIGTEPPYQGVVMTAVDVTGEVQAERAAEHAQLLGEVAEQVNAAADPDAALQAIAKTLVPTLADVAAVFVIPRVPALTPTGNAPVAAAVAPGLLEAAGPIPPSTPREGPSPWEGALAAGQTVLIDMASMPRDRQASPTGGWLNAVGARNLAVVPLVVAGELTGALVLLAAGERAPYVQADVPFLEDVAARAGAAVAHVRNFAHQRQTALTLQRALLPAAPPALPGMRVAARYVAGTADVEVGGDWWDVHPLGDGRVGIGVGDVSGRGVPAAVLMGQARAGMRTAAHARLSPVELLTVLDAHVTDLVVPVDDSGHRLPAKFATAAYAIIDPAEGVLRVANAGHPPLLVRYPCGRVQRVECPPGPPLGLGMGGYQEVTVDFPDGALLVAFTDGLVESSTVDVDTGIEAVERTVLDAGPDAPLDVLADKVLGLADGTDDTALVLLQRVDDLA